METQHFQGIGVSSVNSVTSANEPHPPHTMASLTSTYDLAVCTACGTQFDETDTSKLTSCKICDDPRQFVPPTGQAFTTLADLTGKHHNEHAPLPNDDHFHSLWTEPKFSIGQRAILIQTPHGNVLWDCIPLLDAGTKEWIDSLGGLVGVVISHPHYWNTHLEWAEVFKCPVYLNAADEEWLCRADKRNVRVLIPPETDELEIPGKDGKSTGVKILRLGGHFPGSMVALYRGRLLIADTLVTTPSGLGDWAVHGRARPEGMNSFVFMWSIPNMIPLPPDEIASMWKILKEYDFISTHGAFVGTDVYAEDVKQRVLDSMKIEIRGEGYTEHALLSEA